MSHRLFAASSDLQPVPNVAAIQLLLHCMFALLQLLILQCCTGGMACWTRWSRLREGHSHTGLCERINTVPGRTGCIWRPVCQLPGWNGGCRCTCALALSASVASHCRAYSPLYNWVARPAAERHGRSLRSLLCCSCAFVQGSTTYCTARVGQCIGRINACLERSRLTKAPKKGTLPVQRAMAHKQNLCNGANGSMLWVVTGCYSLRAERPGLQALRVLQ